MGAAVFFDIEGEESSRQLAVDYFGVGPPPPIMSK